jgi:hypothetical protein
MYHFRRQRQPSVYVVIRYSAILTASQVPVCLSTPILPLVLVHSRPIPSPQVPSRATTRPPLPSTPRQLLSQSAQSYYLRVRMGSAGSIINLNLIRA